MGISVWFTLVLTVACALVDNDAHVPSAESLAVTVDNVQHDLILSPWIQPTELDAIANGFCRQLAITGHGGAESKHLGGDCLKLRNSIAGHAREMFRHESHRTHNDIYNTAVHRFNTGSSPLKGLAVWDKLLRSRRGVPYNELPSGFWARRRGLMQSRIGLLAQAWSTGSCDRLIRVPSAFGVHPHSLQARGSAFVSSVSKLQHDCEQIEHLVGRGRLPKTFVEHTEAMRELLQRLATEGVTDFFTLSPQTFAAIGDLFQTFVYSPPLPPVHRGAAASVAVNDALDWRSIEDAYLSSQVVSADGMLTSFALQQLIDFCQEATIFFDVKPGYLGAYMNEGFSHPLLVQIANELRVLMPRVLGDLPLTQMWAYKYVDPEGGRGIKVHADPAKVNLNFWITPDEAHVPEGGGGGLLVYLREPPPAWSPDQANDFHFEADIMAFLEGAETRRVTYAQNRFVMFNSKLFHRTDTFKFRRCYTCRRINLTFLFG